jgi:RNA polymerase sigma factor (sigma-70 family)
MPFSASKKELQDSDLLLAYKNSGDVAMLGTLYTRYTPLVFGVCLKYLKDREESKDAVMQLFEKLVTTLKEHEVTHFKSWLYATARNFCLMKLRAAKGKTLEELSPFVMESATDPHLDDNDVVENNLSQLEQCMETLIVEQKKCVQLFYLQQKCYKEVSDITGFDMNKVKSYLQNGKRNLKICLERNGES